MTRALPDEDSIVNHVTRDWPASLAVFKAFGIETCCGGGLPISRAAERAGADPGALLKALREAIGAHV